MTNCQIAYMRKQLALLGGLVGALFVLFILVAVSWADEQSNWLNSDLKFQKEAETQSLPSALYGNIDCATDSSGCAVSTLYGAATQNSTVRLNGTGSYYPILSYVENRQRYLPIPNSSTAITYTAGPVFGLYFYFNYSFSSSIVKTFLPNTLQTAYKLARPPDGVLADKTGNRLAADVESMSFSPNGRWMVISIPNVAVARVNLQTFEVVPFGAKFNYGIGLSPAAKTAITNDGRYAVVASKDQSRFMLYDLSTCASTPNTISGPVSCQSRDLKTFITQQAPGYESVAQARFLNEELLSIYAAYRVNNVPKTARFLISNANIASQIDYLALGESYISGEGAFNYQAGTDTKDNRCHLSFSSYPYLIGKTLNFSSYQSVACSGALIDDITNSSDNYRGQAEGKKGPKRAERSTEAVDSIIASFNPGYINQSDFVARYRPKVINLSIVGNDIGFSKIVTKCAAPWNTDNCYESYEDRLELIRQINSKFPDLVNTYNHLKNRSSPDSRIYIIGYPQIAKTNGDCALNVRLSDKEAQFAEQLIVYLNSVIKAAADKAGVYYVDTQDAFNGHRLCEAGPGSVAMNGLTAGNDAPLIIGDRIRGPIGNESYHPNEFGHMLLENKILAVTKNLTAPMPAPNPNAVPPAESGLDILNAPRQNRPVYAIQYNGDMTDDILFQGETSEISIDGMDHSLTPNDIYKAEFHSSPTPLGNFSADSGGNIKSQITIPANIPIGFHTLHFFGANLAGEKIDIFKNVYVAASPDDYDGDGVHNSLDPCFFIEPSGQDFDQDRIDDACDGVITEPPDPITSPPAETEAVISATSSTPDSPNSPTSTNSPINRNLILQNTTTLQGGGEPTSPDIGSVSPQVLSSSNETFQMPSTTPKSDSNLNSLVRNWQLVSGLLSLTAASLLTLLWKNAFYT